MPRYHVFLSHASADKPAVEHFAHKLREEGLEPFLDKWHLIPGEPWQEALEEALDQSRTCAVFLGKALGPWQNEEMRSALETRVRGAGFRVIPVLLPGGREPGKEELPRFLRRLTWVDFRTGLDDEDAYRRLLAGIKGKPPGPGSGGEGGPHSLLDRGSYRCMAPAREPFVQRNEYAKVRDALLLDGAGAFGRAPTVGITTAIHGAGGFGKTALAIELCYDEQLREHFPDGILWTTMGEEIDAAGRLARVRDLIRWWTEKDPPAFETVPAASAHLRQALVGKRVLLVVDDVWRPEDVTPLQGLAALLVTTRDSRTLPTDSVWVHVDAMEVPEAVRLLEFGLPNGIGDLRELAKLLGEWPLLLKIVNGQLSELIRVDGFSMEQAIQEVRELLEAEGLTDFDRNDWGARNLAVSRTLAPSLLRLSPDENELYGRLAVLPEDRDVPLTVLARLWGIDPSAVRLLCGRLYSLSLLLRFDRQVGVVRLHDVIRDYLVRAHKQDLSSIHSRLLTACRPQSGEWADLPRTAAYLWRNLAHHMVGAGERGFLRRLLLSFNFLRSKLEATDINSLLADYAVFVEDPELRLVQDALRLSAHVLTRHPNQLSGQLLGRLLDRRDMGICSLLQASEGSGAPWLRPRTASLARPGGALIRTIDHPGGAPQALAVLSDGRVVSGSDDGILRVWDVESGKTLQILEGHSGWVSAVAVLNSRRVISGSGDRTLRVWDVESGQTLQTLWHSSEVRALAVLDSRRVVSVSFDQMLWVWDVESGQTLQTPWHSSEVQAVAVLDSRRVISVSSDQILRVWDVESGQALQTFEGRSDSVRAVAVLDSRRVVSGSFDGTLRVWDLESGQTLQTLEKRSDLVRALAMLDSRRVVSGSFDGTLWVWDVESGQTLQTLEGHSDLVRALAVLDSRRVVSGSYDGTLRVWDVKSGQTLQTLEKHSGLVSAIAVLDSRRVVSGSYDGTLRVWDVETGQTLQTLEGPSGYPARVSALAVLDSHRVVSGSSGALQVWDVESGWILKTLWHSGVGALAVLDSRRMVSGSHDGTLRVWDVETGQTLQILRGHSNGVTAVAVLDSRRVVSGASDGTLRVWDVESGRTLKALWHSGVGVLAVLDSGRVVSASSDGTLRVWDFGNPILHIVEGSSYVRALARLDSCRVVSGSHDRTLRVWNVESRETVCLFTLDSPATAVAVIPDRRMIVAGDDSGRVHFFDFVEA